jgi:acetoin utilization protein AcuB
MRIKDIMTHDVVTITSTTPVIEAERILAAHGFERLPVVDADKLVGLVTKDNVLKAGPSAATTLTKGEAAYLLTRLTVAEVMKRNVVTVSPETTVEKAVAVAQASRVGCLPVLEGGRVKGIVTTNDFFYKILNPLFGLGQKGARLNVSGGAGPKSMEKVLGVVNRFSLTISSIWRPPADPQKNDLIIQFNESDVAGFMDALRASGFEVESREFDAG